MGKNKSRENSLRNHLDYQEDEEVLTISEDFHKKLNYPTKGPYPIIQVYSNSTVCVKNGTMTENINIRHCCLFTDKHKVEGIMPWVNYW